MGFCRPVQQVPRQKQYLKSTLKNNYIWLESGSLGQSSQRFVYDGGYGLFRKMIEQLKVEYKC